MDIGALLTFAPLIVGLVWLGYLFFKKDLPSSNLGSILTYFIGVIIVFIAVGWLIDFFVIDWANDRLQNADNSGDLQEFIDTSEDILQESFTDSDSPANTTNNTQPNFVIVTPVVPTNPNAGGGNPGPVNVQPQSGGQHVVAPGETLFSIAGRYGTTVNAIMQANNLVSDVIYAGQVLVIPASP